MLSLRPILAGAVLILFFANPCSAADVADKTVLDNGLTVLTRPMPSSEIVSIYAYVKTGSATEGEYSGSGISHFVEHMLFKGTARRPVGEIAREVKALGGTINAHTSFDYTFYTLDVPKGKFKEGLDIISDMLMFSTFDAQEVLKEQKVIQGEVRLYLDDPDRKLNDDVFRNVYIRHPYRHPIIGDGPLFDRITRDELVAYYRSRYVPNNIILSVAGAFDPAQALPLIRSTFKAFKPQPYPERSIPLEPPQVTPRYIEEYYPTQLFRFSMAYQGVAVTDPDMNALDVVSMALGRGESSRLYDDIYKKKKLVEQISCSNFTPADRGIFEISGAMTQDNFDKVQAAVKSIIAGLAAQGLTKPELDKTKRQALSQFVFANQTSSSLAYSAASDEALTGDAGFSKHYVEAIKNVTNEDIKRVVRRYLKDEALTVTVMKPQRLRPAAPAAASQEKQAAIQKIVLPNGLTVLLKEDHSIGLVAINAVVNGGLRQEKPGTNGISQLISLVWPKGSKNHTDTWIAEEMERRGGSLGGYAGRNSFGLQAQVLADDAEFALGLLGELIQAPAFSEEVLSRTKAEMAAAIDTRDDDVRDSSMTALMGLMYQQHPFGMDLLGSKASVASLKRDDVVAYYNQLVHPGNMVISVVGDINPAAVRAQLTKIFAAFKAQDVGLSEKQEPVPDRTRRTVRHMDREQAMVMVGFQAPRLKDSDRWSMEIIDKILGAGLSGRLFTKIRDELGQAYTVGSNYIPGIDTGTMVLFVLTTKDKVDTVKDIITSELHTLARVPVPAEELKDAKAYAVGRFKMGLVTFQDLGFRTALDELYGQGYDLYQKYEAKINAVEPDDVRRAAEKYLDIHKASIVVTEKP